MKDLIETAIDTGNIKILINALYESGLADVLSSEGPFTIFAPTDEAFSKIPSGILKELFKDKEKLTEIITYHVVDKIVTSGEVEKNKNIKMVNGKLVIIKCSRCIKVNKANIIKPDIECLNGVIHIIDAVLIPV